jgi:hypothetical protein
MTEVKDRPQWAPPVIAGNFGAETGAVAPAAFPDRPLFLK